ncbi:MAG: hypothetical protein BGO24_01385 [Sphingomonas sp. 67-36]|nr:MAG: hypothetical protein BGO24_01385 [Sphingomonas sp. 67-36]
MIQAAAGARQLPAIKWVQGGFAVTVIADQAEIASGLEQHDVQRMIDHLTNGTTDLAEDDLRVPLENFTSRDRAARECALFRTLPLIVGLSTEIPKPGDFFTRKVMDSQLLVVRQNDMSARAYLNRCPHRGGKVELESCGNARGFMCKYHGWGFDRTGALRSVPFRRAYGEVCADQKALTEFGVAERHNFLWVDLSSTTPPDMAAYLGDEVDRQLDALKLAGSVVGLQRTFSLPINWKLVLDGVFDVLHPPFLHPDTVAKIIHSKATVWLDYGRHGQLINARTRLLEKIKAGETMSDPRRYFATNLLLYPNSWIITAPDHLEFWTVWPDASNPARCDVDIRFLTSADADAAAIARLEKSWNLLGPALLEEDWPMEEYIQENALTAIGPDFLYGRGEIPAQHIHRQLAKDLGET